jgi:hypothetical protein
MCSQDIRKNVDKFRALQRTVLTAKGEGSILYGGENILIFFSFIQ